MIYVKNFDDWNKKKKQLDSTSPKVYFHEREAWWCSLGINIGFEQDGKSDKFSRPVVILKTYSINAALVIDKRRLIKKLDVVNKDVFEKLKSAIVQINLS